MPPGRRAHRAGRLVPHDRPRRVTGGRPGGGRYFKRTEPEIVFGATATGIENRPGAEGLTFLDEVWDRGPFRNRGGLVQAVTAVSRDRVAAGELTADERHTLIKAAARADIAS
ncbi:hypothetical protein ABZX34_03090 [Streptomyces sp. NPDC004362]|uniref:hypothetical protein n=1 Tax=unclassified Streptomyces TaxID=2593676 RepID=UPI0033B03281